MDRCETEVLQIDLDRLLLLAKLLSYKVYRSSGVLVNDVDTSLAIMLCPVNRLICWINTLGIEYGR